MKFGLLRERHIRILLCLTCFSRNAPYRCFKSFSLPLRHTLPRNDYSLRAMGATVRKSIDYGSFKYWRSRTNPVDTENGVAQGNIRKKGRHRRPLHHTIPTDANAETRVKLYIDAILSAKRNDLQRDAKDENDADNEELADFDRSVAELNNSIGPILDNKDNFTRANPDTERLKKRCAKLRILYESYQQEIDEWQRVLSETEPVDETASSIAELVAKANEGIDTTDVGVDAIIEDVVKTLKETDELSTQAMDSFVAQTCQLLECYKEIDYVSNESQTQTEDMSVAINAQFNPRSTRDYFTPPPYMRR